MALEESGSLSPSRLDSHVVDPTDFNSHIEGLSIDEVDTPAPVHDIAPRERQPEGNSTRGPEDSDGAAPGDAQDGMGKEMPRQGSDTQHGKPYTGETRARAEEVNAGAKIVPRISRRVEDFFGLPTELEAWFSLYRGNLGLWVSSLNTNSRHEQMLTKILQQGSTPDIVLGHALRAIDDGWLDQLSAALPSEQFSKLSLIFILFAAQAASDRAPLLEAGVPLLKCLIRQVSSLRWFSVEDETELGLVGQLMSCTRMAILATFGDLSADFAEARSEVWAAYGLGKPMGDEFEEFEGAASPPNYAAFIESLSARYPAFVPKGDHDSYNEHDHFKGVISRGADGSWVAPGVMPYVPESILEASALYKSRVRTTPPVLQLLAEQARLRGSCQSFSIDRSKSSRSEESNGKTNGLKPILTVPRDISTPHTRVIEDLYIDVCPVLKSFMRVDVDLIMHFASSSASPTPELHSAVSVVWLLLRWFGLSHVLMQEFLAALVFDCQFHLVAHSFVANHQNIVGIALEPPEVPSPSIWKILDGREYVPRWHYDAVPLVVPNFNPYALQSYTHLIGATRLSVVGKTQRLLVVSELPVEPLKSLLSLQEDALWAQLLQLFKAEVPFNGKRWRYMNMELISAIYLHCPSRLDDDWLSGADTTQQVKSASSQEDALRQIIQLFNERLSSQNSLDNT